MRIPVQIMGINAGILGYFWLDTVTGALEGVAEDVADESIEWIEMTLDEVESMIGNLGASLLEVLEGAGVAVLKGVRNTWNFVSDEVAERRVPAVAVAWAMLVYAITAATIYNRVKSA